MTSWWWSSMLCATCAARRTLDQRPGTTAAHAQCADMSLQNPKISDMGNIQDSQKVQSAVIQCAAHAQMGNHLLVNNIWSHPSTLRISFSFLVKVKDHLAYKYTMISPLTPAPNPLFWSKREWWKKENRKINKWEGRWQRSQLPSVKPK